MKRSWRITLTAAGLTALWVVGFSMAVKPAAQEQPRMTAPINGKTAGEYFKNVTSSPLKGLPVDDFIGAMGVMSAGLGLDCADCHPGAGSDKVDWVYDTAVKKRARQMLEMVSTINKTTFGGAQRVTCWTCHHGRMIPATSIALSALYDVPNGELDDVVQADPDQPPVMEVLDKYIAAMGGAQRLSTLKTYVATGESIGFGGFGGVANFTMYGEAPNKKATLITFKDFPDRDPSLWAVNGTQGWIQTPRALLQDYELVGGELDGQRFEAAMGFPGSIKTALNNWRIGFRRVIDDKAYLTVQGNGPKGFLATLYFDPDTYLIKRMVRYVPSPAGRVLTQIDYGDYRDVNGIKFPFEYNFYWLDGRFTAKIKDVKVNQTIPAERFGRLRKVN